MEKMTPSVLILVPYESRFHHVILLDTRVRFCSRKKNDNSIFGTKELRHQLHNPQKFENSVPPLNPSYGNDRQSAGLKARRQAGSQTTVS